MSAVAPSLALLDAAAARAGDEAAVAAGDPWAALMDRAAGHLARGVVRAGGRAGYGLRVAVVVGKGDNGGDGWAAARRLEREHGAQVHVVAPDGVEVDASPATAANRQRWLASSTRTSAGTEDLARVLGWCDVAVDCLLGTGITGAPRGPAAVAAGALLEAYGAGTTVVACDVPSGVAADDGAAPAGAVRAHLTVTFGALKRGLLLHPGAEHAGTVLLGGLGPRYAPPGTGWAALTPAGAAPPDLSLDADKRARGVVLAVAGASGTSGAAALTALGALRTGAGLVTVAVPGSVRAEVAARSDAGVMVRGLPVDDRGELSVDARSALPDLAGVDAVVAGPGLGHGDGVGSVVAHLRAGARRLVLDADAINVHREAPDALGEHAGDLVLTPHQRELARMGGGEDGPDAWAHRVERVPALARRLRATIVAKGPGTLVAAPDGRVWVTPVGGPALGSGGTGDALAGMIATAIAAADDVPLAVARAVWWHAAAGELAGADRVGRATAVDLLGALPATLAQLAASPGPVDAPGGRLPWDRWRRGRS